MKELLCTIMKVNIDVYEWDYVSSPTKSLDISNAGIKSLICS